MISRFTLLLALFFLLGASDQEKEPASLLPAQFTDRVGTFDAVMTFFQAPGVVAFQAKGTQVNTLTCGGLWLEGDLKADMGGTAFHGRSAISRHPSTQAVTGSWWDSQSSHLMIQKGKIDATGKKLVLDAQVMVQDGGLKAARLETEVKDKNSFEFRMFIKGGEKDFLSMKIAYTRK